MDQPQPATPRSSKAKNAFQDYGVGALALAIWIGLCIRDGWFSPPDYQYVGFNRAMTYICTPIFVFCAVMALSAWRTLQREKSQAPQDPTPPASP